MTILTCPANDVVARLHDRMPVILPDRASRARLARPAGSTRTGGRAMCVPLPADRMHAAPANPAVNRTGKDLPEGPELLRPPEPCPVAEAPQPRRAEARIAGRARTRGFAAKAVRRRAVRSPPCGW